MNDMSSMNRENRKKQLRKQVVSLEQRAANKSEYGTEAADQAHRKAVKRRITGIAIVILFLLVSAIAVYHYLKFYQYSEYETVWEKTVEDGSIAKYINFGEYTLKYTKDGVSCIDNEGKNIWVQSYEMKTPIAQVNENYAVIADQQGNDIYICNKSGLQGVAKALLPIIKVTISAQGVVAAVLEDSQANYIRLYQRDGKALDITVKCLLGGEIGYPLDISFSPDGTQLMGSFIYIDNGIMKSRVAFYNFSEVGKNIPNRLVGGFDDDYFQGSLVAGVRMMSNTNACAFSDSGLTFFSTKNLASPSVIKQIPVTEQIKSVMSSDKYAGIIVNNTDSANTYRMDIYKINGDKVFSKEMNYHYQYADIDGDSVILYNEDSCEVYNMSGVRKFAANAELSLSKVRNGRFPNTLFLIGPETMKEIKLK